ncbi:hypothetical protein Stube_04790 [Streptomyces tubercidicus]|uniref:Uncharacterized protein n=1 Tax=Streptomyces tubercidicus TaxID=47759 RepID=A0A640UNV8_9ACTN|nr:hypothetical protein Stube_04790 [Streptomyces tubercidicus]
MLYCELHEMHNCACVPGDRVRGAAKRPDGAKPGWADWPKGAIIVHDSGKAHLPGCAHLSDSRIQAPKFGWVTASASGTWRRLSESNPLKVTEGNTELAGISRCRTCDATQ